jgi:hypothetical protein
MTRGYMRVLVSVALATVTIGAWFAQRRASADILTCPKLSGSVRVWDGGDRGGCGQVSTDNDDWRFVGRPAWQDRIDQFGNENFVSQRTMCLYEHIRYGGARVALPPGNIVTWDNIVSSNRWKPGTGC